MALGGLPLGFLLSLMPLLQQPGAATEATAAASTLPGCNATCGDVTIPYPFAVGDSCCAKEYGHFKITCNYTTKPPKAFTGEFEVTDISLTAGQLRVKGLTGYDCYNSSGNNGSRVDIELNLSATPFTFSHTLNKFVVLGCDTFSLINGEGGANYTGGCLSYCRSLDSLHDVKGNCGGVGCCETPIPRGLQTFGTTIGSFNKHSYCLGFNPCGYAFLIEEKQYSFDVSDLKYTAMDFEPPVVLDWSVGNQPCDNQAERMPACRSNHSECFNSSNGNGYNCRCKDGYDGNPYLEGGCRDIDEFLKVPPISNGTCINKDGGYDCINKHKQDRLNLGLGLGLGFGFLMAVSACVCCGFSACICCGFQRRKLVKERRKNMELKQRMFEQNGGPFLQEEISSRPGSTFKLFTEEELKRATNNFDQDQIIGRGGHGIVYKGRLVDDTQVAIKKSKMIDERQSKEFAREMAILSHVNHVNVVKLLGCCLEVEIPMLVYEFVRCGTLFDFIHNSKHTGAPITLGTRLRIAKEAAEALSYLHYHASERPIIHRDIKTSNILLDEQQRAKVSDFGASILAPTDKTQLATVVQGTCGYLDPEYLQTYHLTEKSDVYSFGVVVAELLTGQKPFHLEGGLAVNFVSAVRSNSLNQILDVEIDKEGDKEQLWEVAELTTRCLNVKGEDRPSMKDVVMALHVLGNSLEHPIPCSPEEAECLLSGGEPSTYQTADATTSHISMNNHAVLEIERGR